MIADIVEFRGRELTVRLPASGAQAIRLFVSRAFQGDGKIDVELSKPRKIRTTNQNSLYWALVQILAFQTYGEHGREDDVHEALLDLYSPKEVNPITRKSMPVRSKHLDTKEFAVLIEGAFRELAEAGVDVSSAASISDYWSQFNVWRGNQDEDPLEYESTEDYAKRVTFCEACLCYLGDRGHVAHIKSRGAGGEDDGFNLLRLCDDDHVLVQHQKGWGEFIKRYPHLAWKIAKVHEGEVPW